MIKSGKLLLLWALISIALGVGLTQIPWGDPKGFHGTGFPFAAVYWDYIEGSTHPRDYPNSYAPIMNSVVVFLIGSLVISTGWWLVVRHCRHRVSAGTE